MYKYLKTLHFESIYSDDSTNFQGKSKNRLVNNFKVDVYRNFLKTKIFKFRHILKLRELYCLVTNFVCHRFVYTCQQDLTRALPKKMYLIFIRIRKR